MSHIFDALQKSEGERSETDSTALRAATEFLQRAEQKATSKWEDTTHLKLDYVENDMARDSSIASDESILDAANEEASALAKISSICRETDIFDQFQTLQISFEPEKRMVCFTDSASPAAEAFRLLGVRLRHLRRDRKLKKVLITSTIPQEGKSMIAANLACTLAQRTKQRILLVEGDLRRPSLSQMFGLSASRGLCECLQDESSLTKSIYHLEDSSLWVLPAGTTRSNALELLQSGRLPVLMEQLSAWFEWIIIDSPPVLPLADTSVWTRLADGILLATRPGTTQRRHLERGIEALESNKLLGAVVNCSKSAAHDDYYYRAPGSISPND